MSKLRNYTIAAALVAISIPHASHAIECGEPYTVVRGDSLSAIAARAYASASQYQILYSANADTIGPNPAFITVGMQLEIPCLQTRASTAPTDTVLRENDPQPEPTGERPILFVTATGWTPYTNEDQAQGGMLIEVVNAAMARLPEQQAYRIDFINDWGAHHEPLLSSTMYDFSIAWIQPDCSNADLQGNALFRCEKLAYSEPLFQEVANFYVNASAGVPASHSELVGKRLCRIDGWGEAVNLSLAGISMDMVEVSEPEPTPQACFEKVAAGEYDFLSFPVSTAGPVLAELGLEAEVVANDNLTVVTAIGAVTWHEHPRRDELLAMLNEGVKALKESGEWFQIVKRHLQEHRAQQSG
ncbi:MAG: transporter substrate-binding domain-containing protein [Pseudomonadota bacterium]